MDGRACSPLFLIFIVYSSIYAFIHSIRSFHPCHLSNPQSDSFFRLLNSAHAWCSWNQRTDFTIMSGAFATTWSSATHQHGHKKLADGPRRPRWPLGGPLQPLNWQLEGKNCLVALPKSSSIILALKLKGQTVSVPCSLPTPRTQPWTARNGNRGNKRCDQRAMEPRVRSSPRATRPRRKAVADNKRLPKAKAGWRAGERFTVRWTWALQPY